MKKLILVLFSAVIVMPASAWEFSRNPDRFPSVGFNVSDSRLTGHRDEIDQPSIGLTRTQGGSVSQSLYSIGGDLRLPVSDQLTFTFSADSVTTDNSFVRGGDIYKEANKLDGYRYGLGVRLYFSK